MKRWPLRWKLALWSVLVAISALGTAALGTLAYLYQADLAALDRRLAIDANELFRDIANFEGDPETNRKLIEPKYIPLALRDRLIEVRGPEGRLVYASPQAKHGQLDDGLKGFHTREINGQRFRIGEFQDAELTLRVGADLSDLEQRAMDVVHGFLWVTPMVGLIILGGGLWIGARALRPVERIATAAARITAANLNQRLPLPPANDEIARLVRVLNEMFDRLQSSFEQASRFSADASHELKTPLAVLRVGIEEILNDPETPAKQSQRANELLHQTRRLTSVVENLLLLARADAGRLQIKCTEISLADTLAGALDDAETLSEPLGIRVLVQLEPNLRICADAASVALIFQNLLENAVKYNRAEGEILVKGVSAEDRVEIRVGNTGSPIPKDRISHLFERFYRAQTDERVSGHGLGLSIAKELAAAQGGELSLVRSEQDWSEFLLSLKRA